MLDCTMSPGQISERFQRCYHPHQPERFAFINGLLLIVGGHHHAGQQHEHDDALDQNVPTDFVSPNPLPDRSRCEDEVGDGG